MKDLRIYCNHCYKEINNKSGYEDIFISLSTSFDDDDSALPSYYKKVDLCTKCYNELKDFIKKYVE